MSTQTKYVPDGYHTVTPYLTVQGVAQLIEFLKTAFDAKEKEIHKNAEGLIQHAEVQIGDSVVMLGEARGEWTPRPSTLYLYVPDVDATYQRALSAGAASVREPADQYYGDRSGGVRDASGNQWWIATTKKMFRRGDAAAGGTEVTAGSRKGCIPSSMHPYQGADAGSVLRLCVVFVPIDVAA